MVTQLFLCLCYDDAGCWQEVERGEGPCDATTGFTVAYVWIWGTATVPGGSPTPPTAGGDLAARVFEGFDNLVGFPFGENWSWCWTWSDALSSAWGWIWSYALATPLSGTWGLGWSHLFSGMLYDVWTVLTVRRHCRRRMGREGG